MWQHVKLSDVSLGYSPRYSLVVDEDVKKPNKQTESNIDIPSKTIDYTGLNTEGNVDYNQ